jgi:hypothetical protein
MTTKYDKYRAECAAQNVKPVSEEAFERTLAEHRERANAETRAARERSRANQTLAGIYGGDTDHHYD